MSWSNEYENSHQQLGSQSMQVRHVGARSYTTSLCWIKLKSSPIIAQSIRPSGFTQSFSFG
ncbi:MAG: hypothetical protein H0X03_06940 [Nitrosopumilus sp.]|nr:hypothetical protein [Nitrosopumilus sp.]